MIIDRLENWESYFSGETWESVFDFLLSLNSDSEEKEFDLCGKEIFARITRYETRHTEDSVIETHRKYLDIQTVLIGSEDIECFSRESLKIKELYNEKRDAEFYHKPEQSAVRINLVPGMFAIFFPQDAHMPQLIAGNSRSIVKKVVVKIDMSLLNHYSEKE